MDDTSPEIATRVRQMFQKKSPMERLEMGSSMYETAKYLMARAIGEETRICSLADMRQELFLRFYGNDFDHATRQKILSHLGPDFTALLIEDRYRFEHIPKAEKQMPWWKLLYPLIQARLLRDKPDNSKLLQILGHLKGIRTWWDIKHCIEIALENIKDGERIFDRASEIKNAPDPDGIIDDMFAELRTVPYLLMKGFKNIVYSPRDALDFKVEFAGNTFHIESTYVHGPDFKTQEYKFNSKQAPGTPIYKIWPDKLIRLFNSVYKRKEEQIHPHQGIASSSLIFMLTDLEETYAPWLEHASIQGVHPIRKLILSWDLPVVVFGCGSVYEPDPSSFGGVFGTLSPFDWTNFGDRYLKKAY